MLDKYIILWYYNIRKFSQEVATVEFITKKIDNGKLIEVYQSANGTIHFIEKK